MSPRDACKRYLMAEDYGEHARAAVEWIATELGPDTYVNLMDQYYSAGRVSGDRFPEVGLRLEAQEFREAQAIARDLGLRRLDERRSRP